MKKIHSVFDDEGASLTIEDLKKARELVRNQKFEPTDCPVCKGRVSNISMDILYITLDRQICCTECFFKINYKILTRDDSD